jgi:hypothetical protein
MPYDPTRNVRKDVSDQVKILALERLLKNLYHCEKIVYDIAFPEENNGKEYELYGTIYMVNLNDDPFKAPKLHDCCDNLEYEVFSQIVPDEWAEELGHPDEMVVQLGLEVWFYDSDRLRVLEANREKEKNENISSK